MYRAIYIDGRVIHTGDASLFTKGLKKYKQ